MKTVIISQEVFVAMRKKAEHHIKGFNGTGYGHNDVDPQIMAWMSEYAVRNLYREGGINCHQNINDPDSPDLTIPAHNTLSTHVGQTGRHEEVKCWKAGYSWSNFGCTVRPFHAEKYERKGRARVWFCEVDMIALTVVVHGWATPADILQSEIIETGGRYGALNHKVEVLNKIHEVMAWVVYDKDGWF